MIDEILESMESLRIDVDAETQYCDPTGELCRRYERANEMLDECISIVKKYCDQKCSLNQFAVSNSAAGDNPGG